MLYISTNSYKNMEKSVHNSVQLYMWDTYLMFKHLNDFYTNVRGIWKLIINFNNLLPCQNSDMVREQKLTHSSLYPKELDKIDTHKLPLVHLQRNTCTRFESHSILWKPFKHNEKRSYRHQQGSASTTILTTTSNNKAVKCCWQPGRHVHWLAIKDWKSLITKNRFWIVERKPSRSN